jgi:hypothetical protein
MKEDVGFGGGKVEVASGLFRSAWTWRRFAVVRLSIAG